MQATFALIADRPVRRRRSATPWIVLTSLGAHLAILGGLVAGVQVMPDLVEPPALTIELLRPEQPAPPKREDDAQRVPAASSRPVIPRPALLAPGPDAPTVAAAPATTAPPGFKARELTGGGKTLREAARAGIGCRNADLLALTKAERAVCAETLGEKNKNGPALYTVIDPEKKRAFDGTCKKDDDWCLYRAGKGPYPGILALGRKKKRDDW